ncbi:hypothetical protein NHQ30_005707 [Ciborinia camelliae]|nr:hypothetical protein NHQ30_005707 [Ciborinia camelliae]
MHSWEDYSALADFRTYVAYGKLGKDKEAGDHLKDALSARKMIVARTNDLLDSSFKDADEKAYEKLVAFVLW